MSDSTSNLLRPVTASVSLATNYFYHLLAVAKIGFESDYSDRYAASLSAADTSILQEHKPLLSFGAGCAGTLCDIVFGLPLVLGLDSLSALRQYYNAVDSALSSNDFAILSRQFDLNPQRFFPFFITDSSDFRELSQHRETIRTLGEIFIRNWNDYEQRVWPLEHARIHQAAKAIESAYSTRDIISDWERLTGLSYTRPQFIVDLCSSIKNGPNANSLTYGRVVFFSGTPFDWMLDFISHEIGIHLMFESYRELLTSQKGDSRVAYHANESLAMFYNRRLFGRPLSYSFRDEYRADEYLSFYQQEYSKDLAISPRKLLVSAVKAVNK